MAMLFNVAVITVSLIIGCCVVDVSIDQWFPGDGSDIMSTKDRLLIIAVGVIVFVCAATFVLTIANNNINAAVVTEVDNMKLRMLMLIMANTFMAYAYYQHFEVVRITK